MFDELHTAVINAARQLKDYYSERNCGHMDVEISINGRTNGELKIKYSVRKDYDGVVTGHDITAALEEYFRRQGWNKRNAPLMLSGPFLENQTIAEAE